MYYNRTTETGGFCDFNTYMDFFKYEYRDLYQKFISTIEITCNNFSIDELDYMLWLLVEKGYCGIWKEYKSGKLMVSDVNFSGYGYIGQPVECNITFMADSRTKSYPDEWMFYSYLEDKPVKWDNIFTIGEDIFILKLNNDYVGVKDTIAFYANNLAEIDLTLSSLQTQVRAGTIIGVDNMGDADTVKEVCNRDTTRTDSVIVVSADTAELLENKTQLLSTNGKANDITAIQTLKSKVYQEFYNKLGVYSSSSQKQAQISVDEFHSTECMTGLWIKQMFDRLDSSICDLNKAFGCNMIIKLPFASEYALNEVAEETSDDVTGDKDVV